MPQGHDSLRILSVANLINFPLKLYPLILHLSHIIFE